MAEQLAELTVEQRLAALEKEVALLKIQLARLAPPKENWVENISGSMKDIPEEVWREYLQCCAEIRQADRPLDDEP
ncbi:MAG TPA: hypothetical protein VJ739_19795 [Gemmataceae bacterium]|nr:hypothetical protein [Gemmataceae bacterium]